MQASDILYLAELYGLSAEATQAFLDAARAWSEEPTVEERRGVSPLSTTMPVHAPFPRAAPSPGEPSPLLPLEDLGPLGRGGMGEVRRVRDPNLDRIIAQKIARPGLEKDPAQIARFLEEAHIAALLQHPGVVPVHALGYLPDGRPYFTMREVHGPTLANAIRDVHAATRDGRWGAAPSGWNFRRLIDAFHRACDTIAYAHAQSVLHRDIKPENIMLGRYGEVLVLDWGLARVTGPSSRSQPLSGDVVAGTPAYMAPEQAAGGFERVGPTADVYALGAVLYEILCGRPPYEGPSSEAILAAVRAGPPPAPWVASREGGPPIPVELEEICLRAMAREPEDRPADAHVLAAEVGDWLEGVRRRDQALEILSRGDELLPRVERLRFQAAALRVQAAQLLEPLQGSVPATEREPAWALEDEADRLERKALLAEVEVVQLWGAALTTEPDLPEAHERLAEHYRRLHKEAEGRRDWSAAEGLALQVRAHDLRGRHAAWLRGDGTLTLLTDPPGAEVSLYRYVSRARRLVAVPERSLGRTPLVGLPLAMGSYLLEIRAPGREVVHYPVVIRRLEHWSGHPPEEERSVPIPLPSLGALEPEDAYVPAGWFLSGPAENDRAEASFCWVDGFVCRRSPVTNREFLAFLNDLLLQGLEEEALLAAPRLRGGKAGQRGDLLYRRDAEGRFALGVDAEGHAWLPAYPVVNVDWHGARAYARWESLRTGHPWRLPLDLEWEKAARGVDGRTYPWGDFFDPSFCCMLESHSHARLPSVVDAFPVDQSPYGVRGLAGNVRDWCLDAFVGEAGPRPAARPSAADPDGDASGFRILRGGSWLASADKIPVARRYSASPLTRKETIGFRLVRSLTPRSGG